MEQDQVQTLFGQRVRAAREAVGLTQAAVSARLETLGVKVHQTAIAKIEAGTRPTTVPELRALARTLRTSTEQLVNGDASEWIRLGDEERIALLDQAQHAKMALLRAALEYSHSRGPALEWLDDFEDDVDALEQRGPQYAKAVARARAQVAELRAGLPEDLVQALAEVLREATDGKPRLAQPTLAVERRPDGVDQEA